MWALVAVGAHGALASGEHHDSHAGHALLASLGAELVVGVDHAHVVDGSAHSHHPEQFATAVLPQRAVTGLAALVVVAAIVVAVFGVLGAVVVPAGRGPPGGLAGVVGGRDLLTRFCLARR
ncbi:hypothetical protein AN933_23680 [Mycobacterium intracellulare subsp. chimaera]|nr:hypothetical protein AN933_23680 [Mycobacterium intracellulare subsp. chimaera]